MRFVKDLSLSLRIYIYFGGKKLLQVLTGNSRAHSLVRLALYAPFTYTQLLARACIYMRESSPFLRRARLPRKPNSTRPPSLINCAREREIEREREGRRRSFMRLFKKTLCAACDDDDDDCAGRYNKRFFVSSSHL